MITWGHVRARRADRQAGRRVASDRGETLVEIMCTVVLLGTGFVAIISAIFTSTNISDRNAQRTKASISTQALAESFLQPAIEPPASPPLDYVPQQSYTYTPCASPATYGSNGNYQLGEVDLRTFGLPSHYVATITKIRYFTGTFNSTGPVFTNASWSQTTATDWCYANLYRQSQVKNNRPDPCDPAAGLTIGCTGVYWDGPSVAGQTGKWHSGMQELTIRVDSGGRNDRVIDTLVVVKRDQRCPGTYDNADLGPC